LKAFTPEQLQALSYVSLRTHDSGFAMGLVFFGAACLVVGYLIIRSGYLPRTLGALMQVAGVCYITNSFALIAWPALGAKLFPFILLPPFVAELSMALWLLVKGVDAERWKARSSANL
jgi:predicted transporter